MTPAANVHAWGGLVAFAAAATAPFTGNSRAGTLQRMLDSPPDPGGLPSGLHALDAKDPARRPTAPQLLRHPRG